MQRKEYKPYINSLKGIACLFVMIGHFLGLVRYAETVPFDRVFLDVLQKLHLRYLFSEGFWLVLFFVISGYLCAQADVPNLRSLFIRCIGRFCRFFFPVFFASAIIYIISIIFGFHNHETATVFQNSWFQSAYPQKLDLAMLLRSSFDTLFLGISHFNNPYYVLRNMMIASFGIYAVKYLFGRINSSLLKVIICLLLVGASFIISSSIILPCVLGMCIRLLEADAEFAKKRWFSLGVFIAAIIQLSIRYSCNICVFFFLFVLSLIGMPRLRAAMERRLLLSLGQISFGIYSFHWPLLCSVGAFVMIRCASITTVRLSLLIACIVTLLLTVFISFLFSISFEKWSARIGKWLQEKLQLLILKVQPK